MLPADIDMASFRNQPVVVKIIAVSYVLIFYLTFSPSKSVAVESVSVRIRGNNESNSTPKQVKETTMVLGSTPPKCVNRCFSCRPCMATLVASSPHHGNSPTSSSSSYQGDEAYYLLAWKCKCGNKFFQP